MSLLYWLPLNGDLHNQGLANITATNNGATVDNNGKIGKCYNFAGSPQYINTGFNENFGQNDFSISCWIKITENTSMRYQCIIGNKTTSASSKGCAIYYYQPTGKFLWSTADGSGATEIFTVNSFKQYYGKWVHIAMIRNSSDSKKGYFYINGEREELASIPAIRDVSQTTKMLIGSCLTLSQENYYFTGSINDLRIYDHALSPLEVKRLAQGLVLHYPLNRGGFGGDNLFKVNCCSGGNRATFLENGKRVKINWTSNIGDTYWYLGLASGVTLTQGETYTLSFQCSGLGSNTVSFRWCNLANYDVFLKNGLNTYTFQMPSTSITNPFFDDVNRDTNLSDLELWNFKLEKGSTATPWTPAPSDDLYSQMGLDNNIEYDVSGYGYNGTKYGTLTYSSDTPRYNTSAVFNGTDNCIQFPFNDFCVNGDVFTMNIWWKKTELGSKSYETLIGGPSGFEMDTRAGGAQALSLYMASTRGGNVYSPFNMNEWYMVTLVNDGTNELYYVNGTLVNTIAKKNMPSGNYYVGAWSNKTAQNFKGFMSDFRFYKTALSADDILELYHTPETLSHNGTLLTQGEFVES